MLTNLPAFWKFIFAESYIKSCVTKLASRHPNCWFTTFPDSDSEVELVFDCYHLQHVGALERQVDGEGFEEAVDKVDAIENRPEKKYKSVHMKGLMGLENHIK